MSRVRSLSSRTRFAGLSIPEVAFYLLTAVYAIYGIVQFYTTDPLQRSSFGWIAVIFAAIIIGILCGITLLFALSYGMTIIDRLTRRGQKS